MSKHLAFLQCFFLLSQFRFEIALSKERRGLGCVQTPTTGSLDVWSHVFFLSEQDINRPRIGCQRRPRYTARKKGRKSGLVARARQAAFHRGARLRRLGRASASDDGSDSRFVLEMKYLGPFQSDSDDRERERERECKRLATVYVGFLEQYRSSKASRLVSTTLKRPILNRDCRWGQVVRRFMRQRLRPETPHPSQQDRAAAEREDPAKERKEKSSSSRKSLVNCAQGPATNES